MDVETLVRVMKAYGCNDRKDETSPIMSVPSSKPAGTFIANR